MQELSSELKNHYTDPLSTINMYYSGDIKKERQIDRDKYFIDLIVLEGTDAEKDWEQSDRLYHMRVLDSPSKVIQMEDIFQKNKNAVELVTIRGTAGIGKTTFVDTLVYKWANEEVLSGIHEEKIDFLFSLKCRKLNEYYTKTNQITAESFWDVICSQEYRRAFKHKDLEEVSDKILIVLDGIDELSAELFDIVYAIIKPINGIFKRHKLLISGRPHACIQFELKLKNDDRNVRKKVVEIKGFSDDQKDKYIQMFFNSEEKDIDEGMYVKNSFMLNSARLKYNSGFILPQETINILQP